MTNQNRSLSKMSVDLWEDRMRSVCPNHVLELGTGQGATGAQIMAALGPNAQFTTINYPYPANQRFGEGLDPWRSDPRLTVLFADTLLSSTSDLVPYGVDLLFIDTTHEAWHAAEELCLWQDKLVDGAIVIVDDLNQNDMMLFWNDLPYEKYPENGCHTSQGVFRYRRAIRYGRRFNRPAWSTYSGDILKDMEG